MPITRNIAKPAFAISLVPGIVLVATLSLAAIRLQGLGPLSWASPMVIAMILGVVARNTGCAPAWAGPGTTFTMRRLLRLGIVLLGLRLSLSQLADIGLAGGLVVVATVVASLTFTLWAGRVLGVDRHLAVLIATGTSICGASAVIATSTATGSDDEDIAYAIALVSVFGTAAMILYPTLDAMLDLTPHAYGLWAGASIHEVAQAVAAAFSGGAISGEVGTVAKLSRVILLAPIVAGIGMAMARGRLLGNDADGPADRASATKGRAPLPWFVAGFIAMVALASTGLLPTIVIDGAAHASGFLLTMALAAMGLETDIAKLRRKGLRPLVLGALSALFIAATALGLVALVS